MGHCIRVPCLFFQKLSCTIRPAYGGCIVMLIAIVKKRDLISKGCLIFEVAVNYVSMCCDCTCVECNVTKERIVLPWLI